MSRKFASIELARLYETQGYLEDALFMYNRLDDSGAPKGGAEVRAAIKRVEQALGNQGRAADDAGLSIGRALKDLNGTDRCTTGPEQDMARLLEKWLMLMVIQRRVSLFKSIRARL